MDRPYRVVRTSRTCNGIVHVITYAIERSGEDIVCYCDDPNYAYRIVDLLNADELAQAIARVT